MKTFDAIVIGGGPAGYVAAIGLAKAGVNTCIIEGDRLGGTCLNYGCIPTKSLYHYAKLIHTIHKHQDLGISTGPISLDFKKIMEDKQKTVETLVSGVESLMKSNKITVINGIAEFEDDYVVRVKSEDGVQRIHGDYLLIASGSSPVLPPISGLLDGLQMHKVITSKEALTLSLIPPRMVIIGGGVIGMEFATIYNQFGTQVTVLEAADSLLPSFNKELVKRYKPLAKKQTIQTLTSSMVTQIEYEDDIVKVTYKTKNGEEVIETDLVLCAVGRKPVYENLELTKLSGIIYDERKVIADDFCQTTISHIYAIGDVNGKSLLAHSASKQGVIASESIIRQMALRHKLVSGQAEPKGFSQYCIPQVAFLIPELSQVSAPRNDKDEAAELLNGKFSYRSNGMALAHHETDGICKVDYDQVNERLTFMGILGESSSELIHVGVHGIDHGLDYHELVDSIVAHPSLSEIIHETLLDINKMSIHQI